LLITSKIEENC